MTTMVNAVRGPEHAGALVVPHRYVTRRRMLGEDSGESTRVDEMTLQAGVENGTIDPHWRWPFGGGVVERYGFAAVGPDDARLRVYPANNAFLRDPNPTVRAVLRRALVVQVIADGPVRAARLAQRSPDIAGPELAGRLGDAGLDPAEAGVPMTILDTTDMAPDESALAMRAIVAAVTADR